MSRISQGDEQAFGLVRSRIKDGSVASINARLCHAPSDFALDDAAREGRDAGRADCNRDITDRRIGSGMMLDDLALLCLSGVANCEYWIDPAAKGGREPYEPDYAFVD